VSGQGLKNPSYIFGTMHAICSDDYFFTEAMKSALNHSKQLVLEVDLSDTSQTHSLQAMMLPEHKKLEDYFTSHEDYVHFSEKVKKASALDIDLFAAYKPFLLISALSMKSLDCDNTASYEMKLIEDSQKEGKKVIGLETALSQIEIFDHLKDAEIRDMLYASIDKGSEEQKEEIEMVMLYKQQDIDGLYSLMVRSGEVNGHEKEFLIDRNKDWIQKLPKLMQEKSSFIAVGAAHLPGENGVLELLHKAGYKVEAIRE